MTATDIDKEKRKKRITRVSIYHGLTACLILGLTTPGSLRGGGPCGIPLAFLVYPLIVLIAAVLFIVSIGDVASNTANKYFLFINLVVLAIWLSVWHYIYI